MVTGNPRMNGVPVIAIVDDSRWPTRSTSTRGRKLNAHTDPTIRRIDLTVARLLLTHNQLSPERRPAYEEARKRLQRARVRRFRQLR